MTALTAARLQMTVSLMFHIIFAAIGIGLALLMVISEGLHLRTGREHYLRIARKWSKATGLLFAIGAISGTALSFELGLLWPKYIQMLGAVVGHAFALEGFAFFLEAIFIGLYLYGWDRLSPRAHWLCGLVIAVSGAVSAWLVLGANAWMQLPVGFTLNEDGSVLVTDPIAIFKRYAWVVMSIHATLASYVSVSFAVAGIYAVQWLRGHRDDYTTSALKIAMTVGVISAVLQPLSGDAIAKFVYQTQPAKFAAMEQHFETTSNAAMHIGPIRIPGLLSFLAAHDTSAVVKGLNDIPRDQWPPVGITHTAFDIMVACGTLLMLVSLWFWFAHWGRKDRAFDIKSLMWAIAVCTPLGFLALEAGWVVTEVGRQPWIIQQIMRVSDAVTPAPGVDAIFYTFCVLYLVLTIAVIYFLQSFARTKPTAPQEVALR